MDAERVMAVLKQFESAHREKSYDWCPCCMEIIGHKEDCESATLLADLERETGKMAWVDTARSANMHLPGATADGWRPGSEPPEHREVVQVQRRNSLGATSYRYFAYRDHGAWRDYHMCYVIDDVIAWHDLPPLPEQTP